MRVNSFCNMSFWSSEEMWERQAAISGPVFSSEDAKEGANSFKEKRPAVWQGR